MSWQWTEKIDDDVLPAGVAEWNSLPEPIRRSRINTLKTKLKTCFLSTMTSYYTVMFLLTEAVF